MGVTITNEAAVAHCRALTQACSYSEGKLHMYTLKLRVVLSLLLCGETMCI